ncbi:MAG: hypothetical protein OEV29_11535 [Thermoleophilia bacterium]|nr:hypothetical protein [Thermoleophilia bacterium]
MSVQTAAGSAVGFAGLVFIGTGLWGRREVRRALARERIVHPALPEGHAKVASARRARSLADFIRQSTIDATAGRTYAEIEPYLDAGGTPTADSTNAARDERTGQPLANPHASLWIESTTLQTALMQAYMAFRISESTVALGVVFVATGAGLVAAGRRHD